MLLGRRRAGCEMKTKQFFIAISCICTEKTPPSLLVCNYTTPTSSLGSCSYPSFRLGDSLVECYDPRSTEEFFLFQSLHPSEESEPNLNSRFPLDSPRKLRTARVTLWYKAHRNDIALELIM